MEGMTQRIRQISSRARGALAPLRYSRATLWTILIQYVAGSILWGVSQPSTGRYGTDPDVLFLGAVAFTTFLAAVTFGHFGISAWLAARGRYGVLRALALQISAVAVALVVLVPTYVVVVDPSINGFQACTTLKCDALIPFGTAALCGAMALVAIIPVSLLWFFLARPKPAVAVPSKPEESQAECS